MDESKKIMTTIAVLVAGMAVTKVALPPDENVIYKNNVDVEKSPVEKLFEAAINGDVNAYEQALKENADVNYQDMNTGKTVLMVAIESNASVLSQGSACEIVKMSLATGKVDLTLKDAKGFTLKDYVASTIESLDQMASSYNTPLTYATGRAAEKLSERWKSVLKNIQEMQKDEKISKLSAGKINFHAFYNARKMSK